MKTKNLIYILAASFSMFASNVFAQDPTIEVTDAEGAQGQQVSVNLVWTPGGSAYNGLEFRVDFDNTILTGFSCTLNAPWADYNLSVCQLNDADTFEIGLIDDIFSPGPVQGGTIGSVTFTIAGDAPFGETPLTINNVVLPGNPPTVNLDDGVVDVLGPIFDGTPSGLTTMTVIQGQPDPSGTLTIDNIGGDGTTLSGSCTSDNAVFTVESGSPFSVLKGSTAAVVEVSCDSSAAIQQHTGILTCSATNPSDWDDETFDLSCNVTDGPQPVYGSTPPPGPIAMSATFEDDPIAPVDILVNNDNGQVADSLVSILSGTCTISGDAQISLTATAFDIPAQGTPVAQTLNCDSSVEGTYNATVSCPNNDAQNPNPQYPVTCNVGPQRPAEFASDPTDGATIDMTPGDVKTGDTIPDQTLTLSNVVTPSGQDLSLTCGFVGDPGEITAVGPGDTLLSAGENTTVVFSCPNDTVAESTATYECSYSSQPKPNNPTGNGNGGTASWTYICDVRGAEANVVSDPANGAVITKQVPGGGTGQFDIAFSVDPDEGVDGSLVSCTPDDNVNFTVQSPASFPAAIPSDGVLPVTVQGSDPGGVDEVSTILRCIYEDSNTTEGGEEWTYTLVMEIGSFATFRVTKYFDDNNPGEVRVELNCNHGLPLNQGFNISQSQSVNFVLSQFDDGEPDCTVTEVSLDGYTTTYWADGESNSSYDDDGCYFTEVGRGDVNECQLTNSVDPVPVVITKDWIQEGNRGNQFDLEAWITVSSAGEIVGGYPCVGDRDERAYLGDWCKNLTFDGPTSDTQTVMVYPAWDGIDVFIDEDVSESYIDSFDDCGGMVTIYPGEGDSCTFTNTVFFEGIPTLNQWGMMVMILLMMGVGMVAFRRIN